MTSRAQISTTKQKSLKKSIPRSQVVRIIDEDDELKNAAGKVLKYNSRNYIISNLTIIQSAPKRQTRAVSNETAIKEHKNKNKQD